MKRIVVLLAVALGLCAAASAQETLNLDYHHPVLEDYFAPAAAAPAAPDAKGFIRRWTLLEPIAKPEIRSNTLFDDNWLNTEFAKVYFEGQNEMEPKDGQKVKLDKKNRLTWHSYDSKRYNVKLYRFATGLGLRPTEGLFLAFTVVNAPEDMTVRMAVGSNSLRVPQDHSQGRQECHPRLRHQRTRHERLLPPFPRRGRKTRHQPYRYQPITAHTQWNR